VLVRASLFVIISLASGTVLNGAVKFGDRPPDIHFDKILPDQPLANVRFDAFVGKAVVCRDVGDLVRSLRSCDSEDERTCKAV
jgi:hypothetical protein